MRVLAETNILTRIARPAHRHHDAALSAVEVLLQRDDDVCIVPQVLYEFWAVATRPPSDNGLGMPVAEAKAELAGSSVCSRSFATSAPSFRTGSAS